MKDRIEKRLKELEEERERLRQAITQYDAAIGELKKLLEENEEQGCSSSPKPSS